MLSHGTKKGVYSRHKYKIIYIHTYLWKIIGYTLSMRNEANMKSVNYNLNWTTVNACNKKKIRKTAFKVARNYQADDEN